MNRLLRDHPTKIVMFTLNSVVGELKKNAKTLGEIVEKVVALAKDGFGKLIPGAAK